MDHIGGSATASDHGDRVDQDRFAGSGLPGQDVEAGPEVDSNIVEQGEVLNPKIAEHALALWREGKRGG
jgi:hypothetical protein